MGFMKHRKQKGKINVEGQNVKGKNQERIQANEARSGESTEEKAGIDALQKETPAAG